VAELVRRNEHAHTRAGGAPAHAALADAKARGAPHLAALA
jgi:hypothetical protein